MKPRKAKDLRDLTDEEIVRLIAETKETLAKQRFQHSLKQLQDTAYLKTLQHDLARMNSVLSERNSGGSK